MGDGQNLGPVPPKIGIVRKTWASFLEQFPSLAGKQMAAWAFTLIALLAVWLWGWVVGGGLTRFIGAIPSGAVVAFAKECPVDQGWEPFNEGTGRVIVGAGTAYKAGFGNWYQEQADGKKLEIPLKNSPIGLMQHEGEIKHQLTIDELPRFSLGLKVQYFYGYGSGNQGYPGAQAVGTGDKTVQTESLGKQIAHNLMPPYIGLYFCKKT